MIMMNTYDRKFFHVSIGYTGSPCTRVPVRLANMYTIAKMSKNGMCLCLMCQALIKYSVVLHTQGTKCCTTITTMLYFVMPSGRCHHKMPQKITVMMMLVTTVISSMMTAVLDRHPS